MDFQSQHCTVLPWNQKARFIKIGIIDRSSQAGCLHTRRRQSYRFRCFYPGVLEHPTVPAVCWWGGGAAAGYRRRRIKRKHNKLERVQYKLTKLTKLGFQGNYIGAGETEHRSRQRRTTRRLLISADNNNHTWEQRICHDIAIDNRDWNEGPS